MTETDAVVYTIIGLTGLLVAALWFLGWLAWREYHNWTREGGL